MPTLRTNYFARTFGYLGGKTGKKLTMETLKKHEEGRRRKEQAGNSGQPDNSPPGIMPGLSGSGRIPVHRWGVKVEEKSLRAVLAESRPDWAKCRKDMKLENQLGEAKRRKLKAPSNTSRKVEKKGRLKAEEYEPSCTQQKESRLKRGRSITWEKGERGIGCQEGGG